ncbi:MAG: T9SS type A sorting domain-containing protein [Ignavibacteriae bacterium]|nr:T9SS type A sorting domain-containing protein [Ignavibacteriota bacterium]
MVSIYLSTNNGESWTQTVLNNRAVYSLAISGDNIFAGTFQYGVYRSTDNGVNWAQTTLNNQIVYSLAISGNNIFAGTGNGVYQSTNNGEIWFQENEGFIATPPVFALLIANYYIFAGTYGNSVWRRPLSEVIGINNIGFEIPSSFKLHQNYPNPFNPTTTISYKVKSYKVIKLSVYDILGKEISILVNEKQIPGSYEVSWQGTGYTSGVYYYSLYADGIRMDTKKMVMIK